MIKELDQAITKEGIYCREKESKGNWGERDGEREQGERDEKMRRERCKDREERVIKEE